MACLQRICLYSMLTFTLLRNEASEAKSEFPFPCLGSSPCVKKFMLQVWRRDSDFFLLNITEEDFKTNCTQVQACLNDVTGGGVTEVNDVITAAVSFIYDVCSRDRQREFSSTMQQCIKSDEIQPKADNFHKIWMTDRDSNLAIIANPKQVSKFCSLVKTYLSNMQETLIGGGCTDSSNLHWCMKIIRENLYEKYGSFCPCYGNCDCKLVKSSSTVIRGNGTGAAYMMLVFGIFFLIGAILVKKSGKKR